VSKVSGPELGALVRGASGVLERNDTGEFTKPAPGLYPHQWTWDSAFVAIGLSRIDISRAMTELTSVFRAQWYNGMVPHIIYDPANESYFPESYRWRSWKAGSLIPEGMITSGICAPPIEGIALEHIVSISRRTHPGMRMRVHEWVADLFPKLISWHHFLARERRNRETGLIEIFHPWESGMDNSPRWDGPLRGVGAIPQSVEKQRQDGRYVKTLTERPTNADYARYMALVSQLGDGEYNWERLRHGATFRVTDVFFTAILAAATASLARVAADLSYPEAKMLELEATEWECAIANVVDSSSGLTADIDLRTGDRLPVDTLGAFASLIAGVGSRENAEDVANLLVGQCWAGHDRFLYPAVPSTSPCSGRFNARQYWRGPTWPVMNWLLTWGVERCGIALVPEKLIDGTLKLLREGEFAEYYNPVTGEPLGSMNQSWTAAVALDWLLR